MNKKIFSWIMALALIVSILPVPGMHNHAHAVVKGDPCVNCGECSGFKPPSWTVNEPLFWGGSPCANCSCQGDLHYVQVIPCTYLDEPDFTVEVTCMHGGYDAYRCLVCDKIHYKYENVVEDPDPNAHDFVNGFCINEDEDGNRCTEHQHLWKNGKCVRVASCTATHPCADADFTKVDVDSVVAGNCATPTTYNLLCQVCGAAKPMIGEKDVNNHDWQADGTCANGCGNGCAHPEWDGVTCTTCGATHTRYTHISEGCIETTHIPATCVSVGVLKLSYMCGAVEYVDGYFTDPNNHNWQSNGMCGNEGCDESCVHVWKDGVCTKCTMPCEHPETHLDPIEEANCKNEGIADVHCDDCGLVIGTEVLPVDPDNHDYVVFPFGAGYCVRCNDVNVNYEDFEDVLPEKEPVEDPCDEHQWASLAFGAWYCTKCGAAATDIKPLDPEICDHADTYIEVVEAATCKKEGTAKEICDICEEVLDENVVLPIDKENGHDLVIFPFGASWCNRCYEINVNYEDFIEPENPQDSCDHEWVSFPFGVWLCPKCMKQTEEDPTVPVEPEEEEVCEEHQWAHLEFGAWYCTKCGASATDIKPLDPEKCDHADTYLKAIDAATCVATGLGNKVCDICETVLEEGVELPIDPNAHQWATDENDKLYCELCGIFESDLPEEEPCEHDWAAVATGWYCWKCNSVTLDDPFATEPVVLRGDANDDGVVDGRDVIRLMKYLVGGASINEANSDVNEDGAIDGRDVVRLMKKVL